MQPIDSTFGIGLGIRVAQGRPSKAVFFLARSGWTGALLGRCRGAAGRNVARSFRWIGDAVEEKHRHHDDRNDGQQDPHQAAADVALLALLLLGCHEPSLNLQGAGAMSLWRLLLTVDFLRWPASIAEPQSKQREQVHENQEAISGQLAAFHVRSPVRWTTGAACLHDLDQSVSP